MSRKIKNLLLIAFFSISLLCSCSIKCNHRNCSWVIDKEPTCLDAGHRYYACNNCGVIFSEENIDALGHVPGEWVIDKEPTCSEGGHKHQVCSRCNWIISQEDISPFEHTPGEWIIDKYPTCTESGRRFQICSECNHIISREDIPPLGHTPSDWIIDKNPTFYENGHRHKICTRCSIVLEEEEIPLYVSTSDYIPGPDYYRIIGADRETYVNNLLIDDTVKKYIGSVNYHYDDIGMDVMYPDLTNIEISEINSTTYIKDCNVTFAQEFDLNGNVLYLDGFTNVFRGSVIKNGTIINIGGVGQFFCSIDNCDCYGIYGNFELGSREYYIDSSTGSLLLPNFGYYYNINYLDIGNGFNFLGASTVHINNLVIGADSITGVYLHLQMFKGEFVIENVLYRDTPRKCFGIGFQHIVSCIKFKNGLNGGFINSINFTNSHYLDSDGVSLAISSLSPNTKFFYCEGFDLSLVESFNFNNFFNYPEVIESFSYHNNYVYFKYQPDNHNDYL